jgi:hypothetical protein
MQPHFAHFRKDSGFLLGASNLLGHSIGGACAFDASVSSKLFVTFGFVFTLHFMKRLGHEPTRRAKLPVTLGATEALKILTLNRY